MRAFKASNQRREIASNLAISIFNLPFLLINQSGTYPEADLEN